MTFFVILMSHESLENYYKTNFALMFKFNRSLDELDAMLPYDRSIYLAMLDAQLEKEKRDTNG